MATTHRSKKPLHTPYRLHCRINKIHGCTTCFDRALQKSGIDLDAYLLDVHRHRNTIKQQARRQRRQLDPILAAADRAKTNAQVKAWNAAHPEQARAIAHKTAQKRRQSGKEQAWRQRHLETYPEKRKQAYQAVRRSRAKKPAYYRALDRTNKQKRRAAIGRFTPTEWRRMLVLYGNCCAYCGRHRDYLTMDHVIPISKGGVHSWDNIVPACHFCNSRKGASISPIYQMMLRRIF